MDLDGRMAAAQGAWPIVEFKGKKDERRKGKSQGKGEKVALYSAATICQTPSAGGALRGGSVKFS